MNRLSMIFYLWLMTILVLTGCDGEVLLRTQPCSDGQVRRGNLCVPLSKGDFETCKDLDALKIKKGETYTKCDGSLGTGEYEIFPVCTKESEVNCITSLRFRPVEVQNLAANKIAVGTKIDGVEGTFRGARQCRNYASLDRYDSSNPPSNLGWNSTSFTFLTSAVDVNLNQINFLTVHGLSNNSPIRFTSTGTLPSPLNSNITYFASVVTDQVIALRDEVNGAILDISDQGVGSHTAHEVADGVPEYFDTIDDYNFNQSQSPNNNPWDIDDYLCDSTNFINVTSTASPFSPSGTIPPLGSLAFSQIWQDQLSGIYVTNVLYDTVANNRRWSDVVRLCESLNGGSAGNGWRLPTQKELLQLYINGISKAGILGLRHDRIMTSTISSVFHGDAMSVFLTTGTSRSEIRSNFSRLIVCIR